MKAITLWQPFGTLISIGAKKFETRGWQTNHRGPLAIHTAQRMPPRMWNLFWQDPFYKHLKDAGVRDPAKLPRGAVVCIADLVDCIEVSLVKNVPPDERAFGNWTPGRYAWRMENVRPLPTPIDAKGQQGLWDWKEPEVKNLLMPEKTRRTFLKAAEKAAKSLPPGAVVKFGCPEGRD